MTNNVQWYKEIILNLPIYKLTAIFMQIGSNTHI
jgi:hypothetical protein